MKKIEDCSILLVQIVMKFTYTINMSSNYKLNVGYFKMANYINDRKYSKTIIQSGKFSDNICIRPQRCKRRQDIVPHKRYAESHARLLMHLDKLNMENQDEKSGPM